MLVVATGRRSIRQAVAVVVTSQVQLNFLQQDNVTQSLSVEAVEDNLQEVTLLWFTTMELLLLTVVEKVVMVLVITQVVVAVVMVALVVAEEQFLLM